MKSIFLIVLLIITSIPLPAQELEWFTALDWPAIYIRRYYPVTFRNTIEKHAREKYGENDSLAFAEMNKQGRAIFELMERYYGEYAFALANAMIKYSYKGYRDKTIASMRHDFSKLGMQSLLRFHCDWVKVKAEYDRKLKEKKHY